MHHILMMIVRAPDKKTALKDAKKHMDAIIEHGHSIDWATFFDEKPNGTSGESRWGKHQPVVQLDTKEGAKCLIGACEAMFHEFQDHLKSVREKIDLGDEELFADRMFRYNASVLHENEWLFYGEEDISIVALNSILYTKMMGDDKFWIIPADVHT
jgi:hypothetical protein